MDVEDIPDIEPAVPAEPDFFGEDGGGGILSLSSDSINPTPLPPENILDGLPLPTSELKYDDEMCEFDEFLVGIEALVPNKNGENTSMEQDQPQEGAKDKEDELTQFPTSEDKEVPQETTDNDNDDAKPDGSTISSSAPNTPDSRGSAIVRLALPVIPKINIIGRDSLRRKKDNALNELSPSRTLRSRVNENTKKESRAKRKISDDEFEPENESAEEEDTPKKSSSAGRSGRPTRKSARRGQVESDEDEVDVTSKGRTRSGRSARKIARYGFEDDSDDEKNESENEQEQVDSAGEELFESVKKKKRSGGGGSNYTTEKNGNILFTDSSGNVTKIKPASVALTRLSESEVSKLLLGEEDSLEDEDDDNPFLLEVCIDNFQSAVEAVKGGAKRIELCSSLAEGGLTPSGGFLTLVKEKFKDIPVFVMIRPRGGDFVYTPEEVEIMARDISHYKQMGADGFVFGILTKDCDVDKENCKLLKQMAFPLECTFHRAFDKASNPFSALETIISLGFSRILTSGQSTTAYAGINVIKRLVEEAGSRITILAGAGVNHTNVGDIVRRTGVKEVHGSASKSIASKMTAPGPSKSNKRGGHKPSGVKMGSTDDSVIKVTDSNLVALIVRKGRKNVRQ